MAVLGSERRRRALVLALSGLAVLGPAGCTDEGICDAGELRSALLQAFPGDTVRIGVCRLTGPFSVPEGVVLAGQGQGQTILDLDGDGAVVAVSPGDSATTVRDLSIESRALAGVLVEGEGQARLERIDIRSWRGIGIGVEGVGSISISEVSLSGPVDETNALDIPLEPSPEEIATHGLAVVHVDDIDISGLEVQGFARMGALFVDGATEWRGGGSSYNVGTGVLVHGGEALLEDLSLCGGLRSLAVQPPYAAMFIEGARVETHRLEVCRNQGVGLFHDSVDATHDNVSATENEDAALWVQNTEGHLFELTGGESVVAGNRLAGLYLKDSGDVVVQGASFDSTVLVTIVREEVEQAGDGVQIVEPHGSITFRDVGLSFNERVGLLLDVGASVPLTLEQVEVNGNGAQLGAIGQGDAIPADWDLGVTRLGDTARNDEGFEGELDVLDETASSDLPDVSRIERDGLDAIFEGG